MTQREREPEDREVEEHDGPPPGARLVERIVERYEYPDAPDDFGEPDERGGRGECERDVPRRRR